MDRVRDFLLFLCILFFHSGSEHANVSFPVDPAGNQTERSDKPAGEAQPVTSAPVHPVSSSESVLPRH